MDKKQPHDAKRRQILSSAVLGAVSTLGFAGVAAADLVTNPPIDSALPSRVEISIKQQQTSGTATISVINHTDRAVMLNEISASGLSQPQGSLRVRADLPRGPIALQPGQQLDIGIEASTANAGLNIGHRPASNLVNARIKIGSDHGAFNGIIPIVVIDAMPV